MDEQDGFFTPQHGRLLNIATWAKYLSWVVLVGYFLGAIGAYFERQNAYLYYASTGIPGKTIRDFVDLLMSQPSFGFGVFMEVIGVFLKGIVYFLVLKGISLGLNMIVETDINYREQREVQDEQ